MGLGASSLEIALRELLEKDVCGGKEYAKTEKGKKTGKEEPEEPPGYEEARKLAEKYY